MDYNNSTGSYVPVKYAEEIERAKPEQVCAYGQACPVNLGSPADTMQIMSQPDVYGGLAGGGAYRGIAQYLEDYIFVPGFLRANIGNLLRVEFLVGCSITNRSGILREVGAEYIVLESLDGCGKIMCDISSIRFVTILPPVTCAATTGNFMEP